ncbi:MAG: carboxypeptidase-like regulatory domain-containing protein [Candidatus Cyclobacteriaceae bacterium M2_1C_046]
MMIQNYITAFVLVLTPFISYGQENELLTGIATDKKGNPISGCNVMIKGTTIGTVTDSCGQFSLPFNHDIQTLVFHSMSYVDLRAFEIDLKIEEIENKIVVFQLGNYKLEDNTCPKVDKKFQKFIIK